MQKTYVEALGSLSFKPNSLRPSDKTVVICWRPGNATETGKQADSSCPVPAGCALPCQPARSAGRSPPHRQTDGQTAPPHRPDNSAAETTPPRLLPGGAACHWDTARARTPVLEPVPPRPWYRPRYRPRYRPWYLPRYLPWYLPWYRPRYRPSPPRPGTARPALPASPARWR